MRSVEIRFQCANRLFRKKYPDKKVDAVLDVAGTRETAYLLWHTFKCNITENFIPNKDDPTRDVDEIRRISGGINLAIGECLSAMKQLASNQYDLLYCGEIIEHIFDITGFFRETYRVLRPGGILLGTTPNLVSWVNRILVLCGYNPSNYDPFPIRQRRVFVSADTRSDLNLFDYHIRLSNPRMLISYLKHLHYEDPDYATTNEYSGERPLRSLRHVLNYILPMDLRENIAFITSKPHQ